MLAADAVDCKRDRNADEGTEKAPEECPEQDREQHDKWRDREHVSGNTRLDQAPNRELNDVQTYEHS